jgi:GTP diphosphokinase / guanosine-3',5'-bis(diphosphate) 3'-diphosphatase
MELPTTSANPQAARRLIDLRFIELLDKARRNRPGDDLELLRRAYDFAAREHGDQLRASGEPYLSHPLEVAHILCCAAARRG